jgi:hypothetical protein
MYSIVFVCIGGGGVLATKKCPVRMACMAYIGIYLYVFCLYLYVFCMYIQVVYKGIRKVQII